MRTQPVALLPILLLAAASCASAPPAAPPPAAEPAPRALTFPPGDQRLGRDVVPSRYVLDLVIDPANPHYSGTVTIDVTLAAPTDLVRLHADKLVITHAVAKIGAGEVPLDAHLGDAGALALVAEHLLPSGPVTLELRFEGVLSDGTEGLYRVQDGGAWYAFTQFEPLEARAAFPCFDQPDMKARWNLRVHAPAGLVVVSNAPEITPADGAAPGLHVFAETRPLPTYLVALGVGAFDVREAPSGTTHVPLRVLTVAGKGALADFALAQAPKALTWLEGYFGIPYPFDKLDLLAVPNFAAGAMENAGLITFREEGLLITADAPAQARLRSQETMAHELAHMWFGDLVTLAWWDDIWLNEAFATFMEGKVMVALEPAAEPELELVRERARGMGADSRAAARAIRQKIETAGDVYNAFDGITYMKGAAVLRMIEAWIGEPAFQAGVRAYLSAHADGNAVTADLLGALDAASGAPVSEVAAGFLDQPGTPLVSVALRCERGQKPALVLAQKRYAQLGSDVGPSAPWEVPMCVRYGSGHGAQRECFVFRGVTAEQPLAARTCPTWVQPNADARGYYRWRLDEGLLNKLVAGQRALLTAPERVALLDELSALLRSGDIEIGAYARALQGLAADPKAELYVLGGVVDGLGLLGRLTPEAEQPAFRAFARRVLAPHAGVLAREGLSEDPLERRREVLLLGAFTELSESDGMPARARDEAERALAHIERGEAVPLAPDLVGLYLHAAAAVGPLKDEAKLWERLRDAVVKAEDPVRRAILIRALGGFTAPELVARGLDLLLDGTLRTQDFTTLTRGFVGQEAVAEASWAWLTAHYDAFVSRLGEKIAPYVPYMGIGLCDAAGREKVSAFFAARAASAPPGLARNLAIVLESIDQCARLEAAYQAPLSRFLTGD